MMIDPPIDKLVEKLGCKYALVCLIAKRTKYVIEKKPDLLLASKLQPVTFAAKEIYEDKIDYYYEN